MSALLTEDEDEDEDRPDGRENLTDGTHPADPD